MALLQETQAMCENQLISSHQFVEHLKQCCTQNSETLLPMLADEKGGLRKITSSREGAISIDRCAAAWVVPFPRCNQIWQSEKERAGK